MAGRDLHRALAIWGLAVSYVFAVMWAEDSSERRAQALSAIASQTFDNGNTLAITVIGVVFTALAITAAFSDREILAKFYQLRRETEAAELERYLLVLRFPLLPAVLTLACAFAGSVIAGTGRVPMTWAALALFFIAWQVTSLYEAVKQITAIALTLGRTYRP